MEAITGLFSAFRDEVTTEVLRDDVAAANFPLRGAFPTVVAPQPLGSIIYSLRVKIFIRLHV